MNSDTIRLLPMPQQVAALESKDVDAIFKIETPGEGRVRALVTVAGSTQISSETRNAKARRIS